MQRAFLLPLNVKQQPTPVLILWERQPRQRWRHCRKELLIVPESSSRKMWVGDKRIQSAA